MKRTVCFMGLVLMLSVVQAQVIQLEEARVTGPQAVKISSNVDGFEMTVQEEFKGHFIKDPISFMKKTFDIQSFIASHGSKDYDTYEVNFKSNKGYLLAVFDKDGELLRTTQRFNNLPLPMDLRKNLLTDHKGWIMKKNIYVAYGDEDQIDKQFYKVTLKNGNKTQRVKITPPTEVRGRLALNQ